MDDIICIYKAYNSTEADLIKSQLEGAGIPCYLRTDNAGGVLPHLTLVNGIGIMVRADDEDIALEVLKKREDQMKSDDLETGHD